MNPIFYNINILNLAFKITLCNNTRPDFNVEEVASVKKNKRELMTVLEDMADHLPKEDPSKGNKDTNPQNNQITKF